MLVHAGTNEIWYCCQYNLYCVGADVKPCSINQ